MSAADGLDRSRGGGAFHPIWTMRRRGQCCYAGKMARSEIDVTRTQGVAVSAGRTPKRNAERRPWEAGRGEHLAPEERAARGKAQRVEVPRSVHAAWEPASHRSSPVDLLEEQAKTRVTELVPIRYGRMLVSPFTFFRGAAYVMAADLADMPRTAFGVQLCGDAHLSNFGVFAAPDRRLIFSINDFDETLPGPFEWDVKRLVASFAIAGRDRGFDAKQRRTINMAVARSYRAAMAGFAGMGNLETWYARVDVDDLMQQFGQEARPQQLKVLQRDVARARTKDNLKAFAKLTEVVEGRPRFVSDPPLIVPVEELARPDEAHQLGDRLRSLIRTYARTLQGDRRHLIDGFEYEHSARKVVGVGSVGTRAWIVLLTGRDGTDPLILQAKEAEASVLEPFLGKSRFANHGQRVVEGQWLMQAASDILLGWVRAQGVDGVTRDFYVRQLWDAKGSAVVETMAARGMAIYAEMCGRTLAKAHARSGDPIAMASYLGTGDAFDQALTLFAETYADQNERDYRAFSDAVAAGQIEASTGL
jgi:uncharacterized protein (DUF2252 family)